MWTVTLDDKKCCIDDLTPAVFQAIADRHNLSWYNLYSTPAANIDAFYELLVQCAAHVGVPAPEAPKTMSEAVAFLAFLEYSEEDDRPKAGTSTESPPLEDVPATT